MLQGKKIGFTLSLKQLGDSKILSEIEKILLQGAEIFIIILSPEEKKEEGIKNKFQSIFRHLSLEILKKRGSVETPPILSEKKHENLDYPFLDLLVVVPDSGHLLGLLEQMTPEDHSSPPLVVVPSLENEPAPLLSYISSLMKKKGIYFVPFGPVDRKQEKKEKTTLLYSRLDLLTETCAAALEGVQLKPSTWENHTFPH
ncbi:MAG: hypothetical protein Q7J85_15130 [Bacillota bacterium]|nr:hypothetical protein [Bacillota bacterium]